MTEAEDIFEKLDSILRRLANADQRLEDLELWVANYEEREARKSPCH